MAAVYTVYNDPTNNNYVGMVLSFNLHFLSSFFVNMIVLLIQHTTTGLVSVKTSTPFTAFSLDMLVKKHNQGRKCNNLCR